MEGRLAEVPEGKKERTLSTHDVWLTVFLFVNGLLGVVTAV